THLNAFAYGLTGENRDHGDCLQPERPECLTGGSSSGSAASVLSGSAMIGLGTDTGGSLRVPAALCGLVSLRLTPGRVSNAGWFPLAETYTGGGWVQRHLADVAWVAAAALGLRADATPPARLGVLQGSWLGVCEKPVAGAASRLASWLSDAGFAVEPVTADGWEEALEIFVPLQAREAFAAHAELLARHAAEYEPAIRARLETGRDLPPARAEELTARRDRLVARLDRHWERFDVLVAPASPLTRLAAGGDHGPARRRLLQLTTPASLARWPALTVPWMAAQQGPGIGFQFLASRGGESALLALANRLAEWNWQAGGELTA
ncbi:MAG TPA: amidase family protein, partial [Verrucomicrobiota bacterium]|nr:amidase family protein [Verrucomicrobiota bacterium]